MLTSLPTVSLPVLLVTAPQFSSKDCFFSTVYSLDETVLQGAMSSLPKVWSSDPAKLVKLSSKRVNFEWGDELELVHLAYDPQ